MLHSPAVQALQRAFWDGNPTNLGDVFRLHKSRCSRPLEAVCQLFSHQFGWELRLDVAGSLQRSQVCRSQDDVLNTADQWKAAMLEKDWS